MFWKWGSCDHVGRSFVSVPGSACENLGDPNDDGRAGGWHRDEVLSACMEHRHAKSDVLDIVAMRQVKPNFDADRRRIRKPPVFYLWAPGHSALQGLGEWKFAHRSHGTTPPNERLVVPSVKPFKLLPRQLGSGSERRAVIPTIQRLDLPCIPLAHTTWAYRANYH